MHTRRRRAFTLFELLIVFALFMIALGVFFPAIVQAYTRAAEARAANNLKQLCLATIDYSDSHNGKMPTGEDDKHFSAAAQILPYIEQDGVWKLIDFDKSIDDPANAAARKTKIATFLSPRDPIERVKDEYGATNYLFNDQLFSLNSKATFPASLPDGTSNTVMIGETLKGDGGDKPEDVRRQYVLLGKDDLKGLKDDAGVQDWKDGKHIAGDRCASWMDGRFLQGVFNGKLKPNDERPDVNCGGAGGLSTLRSKTNRIALGMGDGSIHYIDSTKLSFQTWSAALTPAGGEVLGSDW
jgi:type II secretory pathway pseudopilin PulG